MTTNAGSPKPFKLGLCLAGAVSGGAYSAGVIDFVVEALDAWEAAKKGADAGLVPQHRVVLSSVAGASAGGLTAAALVAVLRYDFPAARSTLPATTAENNPLFDSWVNMTDIKDLLAVRDGCQRGFTSLLDATKLEEASCKALGAGTNMRVVERNWVANPLRLSLTVTNVQGVPLVMREAQPPVVPQFTLHSDMVRFALSGLGKDRPGVIFPDERVLEFPATPADKRVLWKTLAQGAIASAAFPGILPSRLVDRPLSDYDNVPFVLPGADCSARMKVAQFAPPWSQQGVPTPGRYQFWAVDGGIFDNEPVDTVRADLNDRELGVSNPRGGDESSRAVLMVHPLIQPPLASARPPDSDTRPRLANMASGLGRALWNQSQISPEQIALALDPSVYSRFLIAPTRTGGPGSESSSSIAGGSLGGFGGYLSREYRLHDFQLGRRNAQQFLANRLTLTSGNPLFDVWTAAQRTHFEVPGTRELPIIPLVGDLHPSRRMEPLPNWPNGPVGLKSLEPLLQARLDAVAHGLLLSLLPGKIVRWFGWQAWRWRFGNIARRSIQLWAKQALEQHGLSP